MRELAKRSLTDDLSGAWCNSNLVNASILEAISFVTPVLESFSIKAVADTLATGVPLECEQCCKDFMCEESNHSRAHMLFNAKLQGYLGKEPPGLKMVARLLDWSRRHLSASSRLGLAAALEHFTAVLSRDYASQEAHMNFTSEFARELFLKHAKEEIAHRAVVFDLWHTVASSTRFKRLITIATVLMVGSCYISMSVGWILYQKTGRRMSKSVRELISGSYLEEISIFKLTLELLSFARSDYHPNNLRGDSVAY